MHKTTSATVRAMVTATLETITSATGATTSATTSTSRRQHGHPTAWSASMATWSIGEQNIRRPRPHNRCKYPRAAHAWCADRGANGKHEGSAKIQTSMRRDISVTKNDDSSCTFRMYCSWCAQLANRRSMRWQCDTGHKSLMTGVKRIQTRFCILSQPPSRHTPTKRNIATTRLFQSQELYFRLSPATTRILFPATGPLGVHRELRVARPSCHQMRQIDQTENRRSICSH